MKVILWKKCNRTLLLPFYLFKWDSYLACTFKHPFYIFLLQIIAAIKRRKIDKRWLIFKENIFICINRRILCIAFYYSRNLFFFIQIFHIYPLAVEKFRVESLKIRLLAALYPPPILVFSINHSVGGGGGNIV